MKNGGALDNKSKFNDHGMLAVLLAGQAWKQSDQETLRIMMQFPSNGYLTESAISKFPHRC